MRRRCHNLTSAVSVCTDKLTLDYQKPRAIFLRFRQEKTVTSSITHSLYLLDLSKEDCSCIVLTHITVRMNPSMIYRFLTFSKSSIIPIQYAMQIKSYAAPGKSTLKKAKKPLAVAVEKKILPVETDVNRLLTYVCGTNIYKEGGEDVKIKPDSEYPDWLWSIRTGPPPPLEELDPNTKQYWRKLRTLGLRRNNRLQGTKKF